VTAGRQSDEDQKARAEFVQGALGAGADWARFADPKLFGVLILLGLGFADLMAHARPLWRAHNAHSAWGVVATISFAAAVSLAVLSVMFVTFGLFPRVSPRQQSRSLFYFGSIATFGSAGEYEAAVRAKSAAELESELIEQAWEIALITRHKLKWARNGYLSVLVFLGAWAVGRIALAFAG
jgi:hypothetical protein